MIKELSSLTNKANEKKLIIKSLQEKNFELVKEHSYFGKGIEGEIVSKLLQNLYLNFQEEDINNQEYYFKIMNKIIDGILSLKYNQLKLYHQFKSIDQIHLNLINTFDTENPKERERNIQDLINKIIRATNQVKSRPYYETKIQELYQIYKTNQKLDFHLTSDFYNSILNAQRSYFLSRERKLTIKELTQILPLTNKRQQSAIISTKLSKLNTILAKDEYQKLNTSKQQLQENLNQLHEIIRSYKELKKGKFTITEKQFYELDQLFLQGALTENNIKNTLNNSNTQLLKMILNKYSQIGIDLLENITIDQDKIKKIESGYNYNNYLIANKEKYYDNMAELILNLTPKKASEILSNSQAIQEILFLIPLANLIEGFDTKTLESLLRKYPQLKLDILKDNHLSSNAISVIMNRFDTAIKRAEAYTNTDSTTIAALGPKTIEIILKKGEINVDTISTNPEDYLNVYYQMLKRQYVTIPPIFGKTEHYIYETGNNSDIDKIITGKRCSFSCIGPKAAGEKAYRDSLISENADVIIIRHNKTGEFAGRALIFRRGNFAVIAPFYDDIAIAKRFYNEEFLNPLAEQLLKNSNDDNLEHIFVTFEEQLEGIYPCVQNRALVDCFPHADLSEYAHLIKSKSSKIKINPYLPIKKKYPTTRQPIKFQNITKEELSRIKALSILMIEDSYKRFIAKENYHPISPENYDKIYKGQDWYLAIKNNQVNLVTLPTEDPRQIEEIKIVQNILKQDELIHNSITTKIVAARIWQNKIKKAKNLKIKKRTPSIKISSKQRL